MIMGNRHSGGMNAPPASRARRMDGALFFPSLNPGEEIEKENFR